MPDHRQAGKVSYPLHEVLLLALLLALLAVLTGAGGFTDIARFGERKISLLRCFRPFANGTPSRDHLGDLFAALDGAAFRRCFVASAAGLTRIPPQMIGIDGKISRRSGTKGAKDAVHMFSAFAARQKLVLGQMRTDATSNKITGIPALLDMAEIDGAVLTIDATSCQHQSARKITDKKPGTALR